MNRNKFSIHRLLIIFIMILPSIVKSDIKLEDLTIKKLSQFRALGTSEKIYCKDDFNGIKGNLIIFISNHCKISQKFQKVLVEQNNIWKENNIKLICISPNSEKAILPDELAYSNHGDSFEEMKLRAKEQNYNFPFLYDGDSQKISKQFNVKVTPTAYLFNANGILKYYGKLGDIDNVENFKNQELSTKVDKLIRGEKLNFSRTKVYGTSVKSIADLKIAEDVARRYSQETVSITYADKRRIDFFLNQKTNYPKLFYFWSLGQNGNENRENLITISKNFKIFRKRGIKVFTVCICPEKKSKDALEILRQAQLSSLNYYTSGSEITSAIKLRPPIGFNVTPFCRLLSGEGERFYGTVGIIEDKALRLDILNLLDSMK